MCAEAVEESLERRAGRVEVGQLDLLADPREILEDADVRESQAPDWLGLLGIGLLRHREDDVFLDTEVVADDVVELPENGSGGSALTALEDPDQLADQHDDLALLGPPALQIADIARCLRHPIASLLRIATVVAIGAGLGLPARAAPAPDWRDCGDGLQCATLQVPIDHARPDAGRLDLALIQRPAGDPARRIGPLVMNPGGPGTSGIAHVRASIERMPPELLARFDVVGFDPRGIGDSAGIHCQEHLGLWLAADPSPDDEAEWRTLVEGARALARGCAERHGELLPHVGTLDVARDLELLRRALGAEQLSYVGASYGSLLGAVYAHLHPERVRAFVLDGAIDPTLTLAGFTLEQSVALEAEFVRPPELSAVEARIERVPIPSSGRTRPAGPADLALALAGSLYEPSSGAPALRRALRSALDGDGSGLVDLADAYLEIQPNGDYTNSFEANLAVICLDLPGPRRLSDWRARASEIARAAPLFGLVNWNWALPCAFWSALPVPLPAVAAAGAAPILIVARTADPVTPFAWAEALTAHLESGVLLPVEARGHTSSLRGDGCVDAVIHDYLIDGRLPRAERSDGVARLEVCR